MAVPADGLPPAYRRLAVALKNRNDAWHSELRAARLANINVGHRGLWTEVVTATTVASTHTYSGTSQQSTLLETDEHMGGLASLGMLNSPPRRRNRSAKKSMGFINSLLKAFSISMLLCGCVAPVSSVAVAPRDKPPSKDSPSPVQWVDSDNGMLALRLSAVSDTVTEGVPIRITAQIRNTGQAPITVLRVFGDWYVANAVGFKIWDDKRRIRYSGDTPGYEIGTDAFTVVAPNATIEDQVELTKDNFAGIEAPGTYYVRYDYSYDGSWDTTPTTLASGIRDTWRGTISSREVQVTRMQRLEPPIKRLNASGGSRRAWNQRFLAAASLRRP